MALSQNRDDMMTTSPRPLWADREMRLDPRHLPQIISYTIHGDLGEVTLTIDKRGVRMRRFLERSLLPVTFVLPPHAFRGVAARAIEENGEVTVTLELLHSDPRLSVPLLVANDLDDVAADWRGWAEAYQLPMLLVEANGEVSRLDETIDRAAEHAQGRRRGNPLSGRRIRFLSKRKNGSLGMRLVLDGEELIART